MNYLTQFSDGSSILPGNSGFFLSDNRSITHELKLRNNRATIRYNSQILENKFYEKLKDVHYFEVCTPPGNLKSCQTISRTFCLINESILICIVFV